MSRTEPELWAELHKADAMRHGEAQQAIMEDVVRHADAAGFHQLAFTARRSLASAYTVAGQRKKAFPLFARCLSEYDQRPWQYGPEEEWSLRQWYTGIVQSMAEFPDISLDQMYGAFADMERRFTTGGHSLRAVHEARRWVAMLAGDWAEEERAYQAWIAAGGPDPDSVWDFEAEMERLVLRGDEASLARARELAVPVLDGQRTFREPLVPIQCQLLLPLARAGDDARAARAYVRSERAIHQDVYRFEYSGMHIEFCALTGNLEEGVIRLMRMIGSFYSLNRPNGQLEFATSAAVLLRVMVEDGHGAEEIERGFHSGVMTTVEKLHVEMDGVARDLAARFDARNGSTAQGDRVRARLAARPVRDFLPLTPTSRPPYRLVPRGATPDEVLARAEWHLRASEPTTAGAVLAELPEPVPPHLATRAAEARAFVESNKDELTNGELSALADELRRVQKEYRRAGDDRGTWMCGVRWAHLLVWNGSARGGTSVARGELKMIREYLDDPWALAWSELEFARIMWDRDESAEVHAALERAAEAAAACGDQLAVGVVAAEHVLFLHGEQADPARIIAQGNAALDALLPTGANRLAVHTLQTLRETHTRTGTLTDYLAMLRARLDALPAGTHPGPRGFMSYDHGDALLDAEQYDDAATLLTEAMADLESAGLGKTEQWYRLATACFLAGRYDDAVAAAEKCVPWMYNLREEGRLDDPDLADNARLLLATAYRQAVTTRPRCRSSPRPSTSHGRPATARSWRPRSAGWARCSPNAAGPARRPYGCPRPPTRTPSWATRTCRCWPG